ncbi:hypothetical protein HA466_0118280 [Hirschfeldia incana]|nr:hypothetical protein HA466_0118280 [Hirschfeldia incana]
MDMTGAFGSISCGVFREATGLETLHLGGGDNNNWETNNANSDFSSVGQRCGYLSTAVSLLPDIDFLS